MPLQEILHGVYRGIPPVERGEIGKLLADFSAQVVVAHPTFKNHDNIGPELRRGVEAALDIYPKQKIAFLISDGTFRIDSPDDMTLQATLNEATALSKRLPEMKDRILLAAVPYDGYGGDHTPGKGSALKLVFDELATCSTARKLILLDGDLRNDFRPWFEVFRRVEDEHSKLKNGRDFFITARYARHFADASLTRFVVGPLTTLMGQYVPGGISGDIALSKGALQHEQNAVWNEHRRRYGTDISTTFDNIADPNTEIYEVYLGAKLHDITDEAKLSVMPGEVIGAALERMLHYESENGRISKLLKEDVPLKRPIIWDSKKTEIAFIDPGFTDVFDVDLKRAVLLDGFSDYENAMKTVLTEDTFSLVKNAHRRLAIPVGDDDPLEFMQIDQALWSEILYQNMAYLLKHRDTDAAKNCLSYLYTAAFLEFCREKILALGGRTFGEVRKMQKSLGVPADQAENFYQKEIDATVDKMACDFYANRKEIITYM